jgi:4a-hydroxytetrahydrobiopterin dehydratase
MMASLQSQVCVPCRKGEPAAAEAEIQAAMKELPLWNLVEIEGVKRLERAFKFKNFKEALDFANQVGEEAESQDHHPTILVEWGKATVQWWTHVVKGLHRNDFIMAAKIDSIYKK